MRKVCARLVPRLLTCGHKQNKGKLLSKLDKKCYTKHTLTAMVMDYESWGHHCGLKCKIPSMQWGEKMGSSKHAKLKTHTKYAEKMIVAVFEMPKLSY